MIDPFLPRKDRLKIKNMLLDMHTDYNEPNSFPSVESEEDLREPIVYSDNDSLGMSIDDVLELCGRPVGKAMYVENGIRYDQLIYIGVARSENRVITTVTFEDGVLTRQEVEIEETPLSLHCNHH